MPSKSVDRKEELEQIKEEVEIALRTRETSTRTFRSGVAYVARTYDGNTFPGANIETYGQDGGIHAERAAVYGALMRGYNGTDFKRLTGIFIDAGTKNSPITPPCMSCMGMLLEFAHPYISIVKANSDGEVAYEVQLKDLLTIDLLMKVFPTIETRLGKPRSNMKAKLPLNQELEGYYIGDKPFRLLANEVYHVEKGRYSISHLYDTVSKAWSAESSADAARWSAENPAWGQCAITALIVNDHFGGKILRVEVKNVENVRSHYYNQLPDYGVVDFTKQQFDSTAKFENEQERTREYILSYPETKKRYEILSGAVEKEH